MLHFQELPDQEITNTPPPCPLYPQIALGINSPRIVPLSDFASYFAKYHGHVILRSDNMYKISFYVSIPFKEYFSPEKKGNITMFEERCYREPYFKIWFKIPKSN